MSNYTLVPSHDQYNVNEEALHDDELKGSL